MKPSRVQAAARVRAASRKHARLALALAAVLALLALLTSSVGGATLAAAPPPASPILLVTSAAAPNPFGPYLGEVLRAEGFNAFQAADLADLTAPYLASFPLVVLSEAPLTAAQATLFRDYVNA